MVEAERKFEVPLRRWTEYSGEELERLPVGFAVEGHLDGLLARLREVVGFTRSIGCHKSGKTPNGTRLTGELEEELGVQIDSYALAGAIEGEGAYVTLEQKEIIENEGTVRDGGPIYHKDFIKAEVFAKAETVKEACRRVGRLEAATRSYFRE